MDLTPTPQPPSVASSDYSTTVAEFNEVTATDEDAFTWSLNGSPRLGHNSKGAGDFNSSSALYHSHHLDRDLDKPFGPNDSGFTYMPALDLNMDIDSNALPLLIPTQDPDCCLRRIFSAIESLHIGG